jgi:hypothetical protein
MLSLAVAGLIAGYYFNNWQYEQKLAETKVETNTNKETVSNIRPLFKLKDLQDKVRDVKEWDDDQFLGNMVSAVSQRNPRVYRSTRKV